MTSATVPDFIIVGAQKSGTTSLHHILDHHPRIFIPKDEIYFFDIDDIQQHYDFFIYLKNQQRWTYFDYEQEFDHYFEWYTAHFAAAQAGQLIGEDSTTYLASPVAPERIAKLLPSAKILMMLRDPVARAYSHYWHLVESRRAVYTFEETLQYQPENILQRGRYKRQIEHFMAHIPTTQIKVILFEHFIQNIQSVTDEVCDFLGVDERLDTTTVPTWSNKTTVPKVLSLQLLYNRILRPISNKRFFIRKDLPGQHRSAGSGEMSSQSTSLLTQLAKVDRLIVELNAGKRPPMTPETQAFLQKLYARENAGISDLIGTDVSQYWTYMSR
jgi:uncharacterized protein YifE (UPF0438 family)